MYILHNTKKVGEKTYHSTLLCENYRERGKVCRRVLLNLSKWSAKEVEALKKSLRGEELFDLKELEVKSGLSLGALYTLKAVAERLGLDLALGSSRKGRLALLLIIARLISPGSDRWTAIWAKRQATEAVLSLRPPKVDDLYETLDWLDKNQEKIEDALFVARGKETEHLFLYDVTSSYLEGEKNELAFFGYNRDKKKGKKQIVIGLLTDKEGYPVSVEVFKGNTTDTKTLESQIEKLSQRFGVEKVVLVGDKGMIKTIPIKNLKAKGLSFITSISKPEIESLIKQEVIQLSLFDSKIAEVEDEGVRYILRKNPLRKEEIKKNRDQRLKKAEEKLKEEAEGLLSSSRRNPAKALRRAIVLVDKLKLSRFIQVKLKGRVLSYHLDKQVLLEAEALDGCYVIKTDLSKEELGAEEVHSRYKDLSKVETAFRTMKTDLLEIRPVNHRKATRTRGHVLVVALSYLLSHYIREVLKETGISLKQAILALDAIQLVPLKLENSLIQKVQTPDEEQTRILKALDVKLPMAISSLAKKTKVVTK